MRIGFVYDAIYPSSKGGVEKRVYELARRLSAKGNEVHVFCVKPKVKQTAPLVTSGVHYHFVPCWFSPARNGSRSSLQAIEFAIKVFFELAQTRLDAVDCQNFPFFPAFSCMAASFLNGSRVVVTWHEYWGEYWSEYKGKTYGAVGQMVEALLARASRNNAAVSKSVAMRLQQLSGKIPIAIVPNGVDLEAARAARQLRKKSDFIYAGRLERHKRLDLLLDAMQLVARRRPKASLIIVGGGHLSGWLELYARRKGLSGNVTFLPPATEKMLLSLLKSSRVFVLPSEREGFGMAALEANACGIPVVCAGFMLNSFKHMITRGNGVVCAPNPQAMADGMLRMLSRPPSKAQAVSAARAYGWASMTLQEEKFLLSVLK